MDNDAFKETLIREIKSEINSAYTDCSHGKNFDSDGFNQKIIEVWNAAKVQGFSQDEFVYFVQETVVDHFSEVSFPFDYKVSA